MVIYNYTMSEINLNLYMCLILIIGGIADIIVSYIMQDKKNINSFTVLRNNMLSGK
jgi:uncharacterized membrane-anchored protein